MQYVILMVVVIPIVLFQSYPFISKRQLQWYEYGKWLSHTPIRLSVCGLCLSIGLGRFSCENQYSEPMHALCDVTIRIGTTWRLIGVAYCHHRNRVVTAPPATPVMLSRLYKWLVSPRFINTVKQIAKLKNMWQEYMKFTRQDPSQFHLYIVCVW